MIAALQQILKLVAVSENERDSAGEPANLVDGLFAIARALERALEAQGRTGELTDLRSRLERLEALRGESPGLPVPIPPRRRV